MIKYDLITHFKVKVQILPSSVKLQNNHAFKGSSVCFQVTHRPSGDESSQNQEIKMPA